MHAYAGCGETRLQRSTQRSSVWSTRYNAFEGVATLGSCGGHPEPLKGGQWPEGSWYVTFKLRPDIHGWRALEFLAWLINHDYVESEPRVRLYPDSVPPYLNTPGSTLKFALEGCEGASANALASFIESATETVLHPAVGAPRLALDRLPT